LINPPLSDLRVLDISTVLAGPNCARYLADFGADVIKVEQPGKGDSLRGMAWRDPRDGSGLWWKLVNRNKRMISLDLKADDDKALFLRLVDRANVLVENFRPGTLERLGLSPDTLLKRNDKLVIVRVTGFGQTGPYASRPGFASIAESMAGLSAISGDPDGPPMLPPIALTDELTGIAAAFAALVAVHSGVGQVVDVNLLQTVFQIMGPLISLYKLSGKLQPRMGSQLPYTVPRGVYQCSDGQWLGVSASSDSVAARVMAVLGVGEDERLTTFQGRMEHRVLLDQLMSEWCAKRTRDEALRVLTEAEAAAGPVFTMADIASDPHYAARHMIQELDGVPMQGLIAELSKTPGVLRWIGRPMDHDTESIRQRLWGTQP
jgi:crotonobetainyl-CoA:carnitine CoA-transferase CaiB-like acyl-CoA transferase